METPLFLSRGEPHGDTRLNKMHPLSWIPAQTKRLLDVGCNVGELLLECSKRFPDMKLAGVDVNASAIECAQATLPDAEICRTEGGRLPFPDSAFDCVTCIEVIEHIPADRRAATLQEIFRVLAPGGRLVLRCPHRGVFAWMDSNNIRFRLPHLYRLLVRSGLRDAGYTGGSADIVWHHHFTRNELLSLVPQPCSIEHTQYGGLFLFPLGDILRWPFYRLKQQSNPMVRMIDRVMNWDIGIHYGAASFTILAIIRKA